MTENTDIPAYEDGLLSIVMPNYNHSAYLKNSLGGLLNQTYQKVQICFVDDGSTDDSLAIVRQLIGNDPRVKIHAAERNVGVNEAIKAGLAKASGEYLCLAAADDWLAPDYAEHSIALLKMWPQAAFCFSDPTERLPEDTARVFPLNLSDTPTYFDAARMADAMRRRSFHISSNSIVFRRTAYDRAQGYRADLGLLADWFCNNVLALRHGACYLPEALCEFRIQPGSYSAIGQKQASVFRKSFFDALDLLYDADYEDVRGQFERAMLIPEYRWRDIGWLVASKRHRHLLTPAMLARIIAGGTWDKLRPYASVKLRREISRLFSTGVKTV